jgi:hypothetical protein
MYIPLMGCAQQGAGGAPLAAEIDPSAVFNDLVEVAAPATGSVVTFTNQGGFDVSVLASGGTGVYTYAWTVVWFDENSDTFPFPGNPGTERFAVNSNGTTNAARYNTFTVDGARGPNTGDVFEGIFDGRCVVTDGVDAVIVPVQFICAGISL